MKCSPLLVSLVRPLICSLALASLTSTALAQVPIPVSNPGFEDLYLGSNLPAQYAGDVPTGTFPTGPPPSAWVPYYEGGAVVPGTFLGVINPGTAANFAPNPSFFLDGAPEGDNAVLLYTSGDTGGLEYGVEQTLGQVLAADMEYTLTAEIGNIGSGTALLPPYSNLGFFDLDGFPGYRLQLLAGGEVIAEDVDTVRPDEREWETASVSLRTIATTQHLGELLGIRLVNRNQPEIAGVTGIEVDFDDVRLEAVPSAPPGPVGVATGHTPVLVPGITVGILIALRHPLGPAWADTRLR